MTEGKKTAQEYQKKYYQEHKNEMNKSNLEYRQKHREALIEYGKKYRLEHKEERNLADKKRREKREEYMKEYYIEYQREIKEIRALLLSIGKCIITGYLKPINLTPEQEREIVNGDDNV